MYGHTHTHTLTYIQKRTHTRTHTHSTYIQKQGDTHTEIHRQYILYIRSTATHHLLGVLSNTHAEVSLIEVTLARIDEITFSTGLVL